MNAIITDIRIPAIMANAFSEFIYFERSKKEPPCLEILIHETATADPRSSKTMETVVEVGRPKVLNKSSKTTSVIITAIQIIMISEKTNMSGWKIPFLATSIIPEEKVEPTRIPNPATRKTSHLGVVPEPMAEFRKLTASLLTPTIKSETASANNIIIRIR